MRPPPIEHETISEVLHGRERINMSQNRDYMEWFQQHSQMMENLSRTISPALQIAERAAASANDWNSALTSAVTPDVFQIPGMEEFERASSFAARAVESIGESGAFVGAYAKAMEFLNRPAILESLSYLQQTAGINSVGVCLDTRLFSRALEVCQMPGVMGCMERVLLEAEWFDTAVLEAVPHFDITSVSAETDGKIVYDGDEYGPEQIDALLTEQMEIARKPDIPERARTLQQKFWLLFWLLRLAVFLPELPDIAGFYGEVFAQIQETVSGEESYCFTVRERSVLRQEANSKSKVLENLPYDTRLEIVDEIPRWYQVRYVDDTGKEITGWISKISVETDG